MAIKIYKRALAAIVAPEASQERKAQTERCYREICLLNTQKEKLKEQKGTSDQIARLSLVHWKWECRLASLLGLDAPKEIKVETERMDISTVRAIMEAARARRPPEEPARFVVPEIENEPIRQLEAPEEPEPLDAEYINIELLREAAAVKQKRIDEIHEFETLAAHGQALAPPHHPSGRPWLENEAGCRTTWSRATRICPSSRFNSRVRQSSPTIGWRISSLGQIVVKPIRGSCEISSETPNWIRAAHSCEAVKPLAAAAGRPQFWG